MSAHLRQQARARYGLELTDGDVDEIHAQCRSGCSLLHVHERHPDGPSEHHIARVRGVRLLVLYLRGRVVTALPRDQLPPNETALAAAFRRAMQNTPHPLLQGE